ncbi:hypothetical protein [Cellulomonas sp. GbtcB1]|uniref:hypothetical protein n=1 Tax=Cellulomonas sp. GbtcB1 TaxID=2824746 RepID=UPI001C2F73AE|nr:hypothetical protein [Cellulomonas sp. GbtcB1]
MTDYRATMRVELVNDRPTYAEVVIESLDRAIRHVAWPVDGSHLKALEAAASQSIDLLEARATGVSQELLRTTGFELNEPWTVDRETFPAEDGGTCGSIEASAVVSGEL